MFVNAKMLNYMDNICITAELAEAAAPSIAVYCWPRMCKKPSAPSRYLARNASTAGY
jgi:hypothetical protein